LQFSTRRKIKGAIYKVKGRIRAKQEKLMSDRCKVVVGVAGEMVAREITGVPGKQSEPSP
jgi:hypothetical protein